MSELPAHNLQKKRHQSYLCGLRLTRSSWTTHTSSDVGREVTLRWLGLVPLQEKACLADNPWPVAEGKNSGMITTGRERHARPRFRSLHLLFRTVLFRFWRSCSAAVLVLMLLYWLYGGFVMLFLLGLALCGAFYHFQVRNLHRASLSLSLSLLQPQILDAWHQ